jgi:hypothetical protein
MNVGVSKNARLCQPKLARPGPMVALVCGILGLTVLIAGRQMVTLAMACIALLVCYVVMRIRKAAILATGFIAIGVLALPFVEVTPWLNPTDVNYAAYLTVIGITLALVGSHPREVLRLDPFLLFLTMTIVGGVAVTGWAALSDTATLDYQIFVYPVLALALHLLITHRASNGVRVLFVVLLGAVTVLQAGIGLLQSWFDLPPFLSNPTPIYDARGYLGYLLPGSFGTLVRQATGTYDHFNRLGALLVMGLPLLYGWWRQRRRDLLRLIPLMIGALGLLVTYSRGALLGAAIGICCVEYIVARRRWVLVAGTSAAVTLALMVMYEAIGTYAQQTQNVSARAETLRIALGHAFEQPWMLVCGFGYSYFHTRLLPSAGALPSLHSGPVQLLLEMGIIGIVLVTIYLRRAIINGLRSGGGPEHVALTAAVVGFVANSFVENLFFSYNWVLMTGLVATLSSNWTLSQRTDRRS